MELTDRKKAILTATVSSFIHKGEPVGSKLLSEQGDLNVSPATIRNELSDLEQLGYLTQVHTSSGRIPTDKGYRLFVDGLITGGRHNELSPQLDQVFAQLGQDMTHVFTQLSQVMTSVIDYTTIVMTPSIYRETLKLAHLILVDLDRIMVLLLGNTGINEEFLLKLPYALTQDDLNAISSLLTRKLKGKQIDALDASVLAELMQELPRYTVVLDHLYKKLTEVKQRNAEKRTVLKDGVSNMIQLPEFKNIELTQQVLSLLEEDKILCRLFQDYLIQEKESVVVIGQENTESRLKNFSLVLAPFSTQEGARGALGILGPTRMNYSKVLSLAGDVSGMISDYLEKSTL